MNYVYVPFYVMDAYRMILPACRTFAKIHRLEKTRDQRQRNRRRKKKKRTKESLRGTLLVHSSSIDRAIRTE